MRIFAFGGYTSEAAGGLVGQPIGLLLGMRQRKQTRRRRREPWEEFSFLFNEQRALESDYLEIGHDVRQSITLLVVSGALSTALENPRERMIFVSGRTDNRSRSPR